MIELNNLTISRGQVQVLKNQSFSFPINSWIGVLGANGSGKTTLLDALSGRHQVDSGSVVIDGVDWAKNRLELAKQIGVAPTIDSLPSVLTVRQIIRLAKPSVVEIEQELLDALAIDSVLDQTIGTLSSGYRQRVCIYLAFLRQTSIVVLDEPFNWLDPVSAHDLKQALKTATKSGITLFTALHDTSTFVQYCDVGTLLSRHGKPTEISSKMMSEHRTNTVTFEKQIIQLLRDPGQ